MLTILFIGCSSSSKGEEYIGMWYKNDKPEKYFPRIMEISRKGDLFEITTYSLDKDKIPMNEKKETFVVPLIEGYLEYSVLDKLIYSKDGNTLHMGSEVYSKLDHKLESFNERITEFEQRTN